MARGALHKTVLGTSICLIVFGLFLTAISIFSPAWQIADIPELFSQHQHGVWWDCVKPIQPSTGDGSLIPLDRLGSDTSFALKCAYKFDHVAQEALSSALAAEDAAAKEMNLHKFLPHHKAVIFFSTFTFIFGSIAIIVGLCSPCFTPNALLYSIALFMTVSCSILADVIFFFAALRIDTRYAHGIVAVTEQKIGYAALLHVIASIILLLALISSIAAAYLLIAAVGASNCCCCVTEYQQEYDVEPYARWRSRSTCGGAPLLTSSFYRKCEDDKCRPFVVITDDSSS